MSEKTSYYIDMLCTNCGQNNRLVISKGVPVKDFLKEGKECHNCGCKLQEEEE